MTSRFCFGIIAKHSARRNLQIIVGVYDIEGPPVPIPNTVVKLNRAENTWWVTAREDRSLPTLTKSSHPIGWLFFCCNKTDCEKILCLHIFSPSKYLSIPSVEENAHPLPFLQQNRLRKNSVPAHFFSLEIPLCSVGRIKCTFKENIV